MDHHARLATASIVCDVMARWPQTIEVFLYHRMACVGCAMARFCTLSEATHAYQLDCASFLHELEDDELDLLEAILYEEREKSDTLDCLRDRMAAIVNLLKI